MQYFNIDLFWRGGGETPQKNNPHHIKKLRILSAALTASNKSLSYNHIVLFHFFFLFCYLKTKLCKWSQQSNRLCSLSAANNTVCSKIKTPGILSVPRYIPKPYCSHCSMLILLTKHSNFSNSTSALFRLIPTWKCRHILHKARLSAEGGTPLRCLHLSALSWEFMWYCTRIS